LDCGLCTIHACISTSCISAARRHLHSCVGGVLWCAAHQGRTRVTGMISARIHSNTAPDSSPWPSAYCPVLGLCAVSARDPARRARSRMHCFSRLVHACGPGTEACRQALASGQTARALLACCRLTHVAQETKAVTTKTKATAMAMNGSCAQHIRALMSVPSQVHRGKQTRNIEQGQAGRKRAASNCTLLSRHATGRQAAATECLP